VEPWIIYTESQDGYIDRRDLRTDQQRSIRPEAKAGEPHYRFQWNSPVAVSMHNHTTVITGKLFVQVHGPRATTGYGSAVT